MVYTFAYFNPEVAMIALVGALVLFGGKKIPELMRGIGQGVGELKKGMEEGQRHLMTAIHEESKPDQPVVKAEEPKALVVEPKALVVEPKALEAEVKTEHVETPV